MKKSLPVVLMSATAVFSWGLFIYSWQIIQSIPKPLDAIRIDSRALVIADSLGNNRYIPDDLPAIQPLITHGVAKITAESPKIIAYAHGTAIADGKIFIGMADKTDNPFPTNVLTIFDLKDLNRPTTIAFPASSTATESKAGTRRRREGGMGAP